MMTQITDLTLGTNFSLGQVGSDEGNGHEERSVLQEWAWSIFAMCGLQALSISYCKL
jgi:hypothetical protein